MIHLWSFFCSLISFCTFFFLLLVCSSLLIQFNTTVKTSCSFFYIFQILCLCSLFHSWNQLWPAPDMHFFNLFFFNLFTIVVCPVPSLCPISYQHPMPVFLCITSWDVSLMYVYLKSLLWYLVYIPCSLRSAAKLYVLKNQLNLVSMTSSLTRKQALKMRDLNTSCF